MKDSIYIVVSKEGVKDMKKSERFTLAPGERAFRLLIEVPDQVFAPASVPTIRLSIPAENMIQEIEVAVDAAG